jgi:hypothetical protein
MRAVYPEQLGSATHVLSAESQFSLWHWIGVEHVEPSGFAATHLSVALSQ